MKNNNYIVIQGWMLNELKLKGNDLNLFAIIYGFSQDSESEFTGSLNYLCESLNCSRNTAKKSLKSLIDKGLIRKRVQVVNGVTFNKYSVIDGVGQKLTEGGSKLTNKGGQKLTEGGSETDPNNTINNTNINTNNNTSAKADGIDFDLLLEFINKTLKRNFKVIHPKTKASYKARLKDGYTKEDIMNSVINSVKEDFHKESNFKYLTPEYFSRHKTIEMFSQKQNNEVKQDLKEMANEMLKRFKRDL